MKRNRKKKKVPNEVIKDPRDKWIERIIYAFLILIALLGITIGYIMSNEFIKNKKQEDRPLLEIEK